eukprot:4095738-Prymnesium_polylepis.1
MLSACGALLAAIPDAALQPAGDCTTNCNPVAVTPITPAPGSTGIALSGGALAAVLTSLPY